MAHNHGATGHAARKKARGARAKHYRESGRREVNKAIKLERHIDRYGMTDVGEVRDGTAEAAWKRLPSYVIDAARKIVAEHKRRCA
jgi:hypothetical protein